MGFSKWTVLIGRMGFDTIPSIPDPTLSLNSVPGAKSRVGGRDRTVNLDCLQNLATILTNCYSTSKPGQVDVFYLTARSLRSRAQSRTGRETFRVVYKRFTG